MSNLFLIDFIFINSFNNELDPVSSKVLKLSDMKRSDVFLTTTELNKNFNEVRKLFYSCDDTKSHLPKSCFFHPRQQSLLKAIYWTWIFEDIGTA